jgi:polyisoprenoid-binding protein YceI|tara:strand:+ start:690 stop:1301 length:612 start_codon:yes stop_codon:yes gene_type:complete
MKKLIALLMFVSLVSCNMNSNKTAETNDVAMTAADATYNIVQDESSLMWTGREVSTSSHYGTINFTSGQFEIADGLISQGEFLVDMTSITVQDLTGGSKERLEGHLRSDDFFSVESFPTAHLYISSSEVISNGKWMVNGFLTIKDISHPVLFEMVNTEDGWNANLVFDRSKYNVKFRSGTFFENLGDKLIYDDIELKINLKTS